MKQAEQRMSERRRENLERQQTKIESTEEETPPQAANTPVPKRLDAPTYVKEANRIMGKYGPENPRGTAVTGTV
jgi:hypothetical protein